MDPQTHRPERGEESQKVKRLVMVIGLMLAVLCFLGVLLYAAGGALIGQLSHIQEMVEAKPDQRAEAKRPQEAAQASSGLEIEPTSIEPTSTSRNGTQPQASQVAPPRAPGGHGEPLHLKVDQPR